MRRRIILHGKLRELYEDEIHLHVDSVSEAIRGLCFQIEGFRDNLQHGDYQVYLGDKNPENSIDEGVLDFQMGDTRDIHIQPVIEGSKSGSGKLIAGAALVALSFVPGVNVAVGSEFSSAFSGVAGGTLAHTAGLVGYGLIGKLGIGLALAGVAQLLSPQIDSPKSSAFERADERPSFLFNGPTNITEQGGPVPLVYGLIRVGSIVVSSGLSVEKLDV